MESVFKWGIGENQAFFCVGSFSFKMKDKRMKEKTRKSSLAE